MVTFATVANTGTAVASLSTVPSTTSPATISTTSTYNPDSWQCVTSNITQYFDPPKPTGDLLTALFSYGDNLITKYSSDIPDSAWCGFSTAVPSAKVSEYSSWGSAVSSWWSAKSADAMAASTYCPENWAKAERGVPGGKQWRTDAIAFSKCYVLAHPTQAAMSN